LNFIQVMYLNLLLKILQATNDSNGEPKVIYSILQANLNKLDDRFAAVLRAWATTNLPQEEPEDAWAIAADIVNLSNRLAQFHLGNRGSNLEIAIAGYESSLAVFNRNVSPQDWATTKNNLGNAYRDRICGERSNNLEAAISCYTEALQVRTREQFPEQWATTKNNLGTAYGDRIYGERAENLEAAISCYIEALQVRTREQFPEQWAVTKNNLAIAYSDRICGERKGNLQASIICYRDALQVYTLAQFPERWAAIQNNLGTAYYNAFWGEKAEFQEAAINCYTKALQVYTLSHFPEDWGMTKNNLGNAYRTRLSGDRSLNLETAISCYTEALQVYTYEDFPDNHAATLFNLGLAYRDAQQFENAYTTLTNTINIVDSLRSKIVSGDAARQKLADQYNRVYQNLIEICLELNQYTEAIEYIERSKSRSLVEVLATKTFYPKRDYYSNQNDYQKTCTKLDQLRTKITTKQRELEILTRNKESEERNYDYVVQLRQGLSDIQQQLNQIFGEVHKVDPSFKLNQQIEPISFSQIQTIIDSRTCLAILHITDRQVIAFIITRNNPDPIVRKYSVKDRDRTMNRAFAYLRLYYRKRSNWWKNQLVSRLKNLAKILHIEEIFSHIPTDCDRLILIPHRVLHLLPLHALPFYCDEASSFCLLDKFPRGVQYAPSCQILQLTQNQQRPNFHKLFAIQNPTNDLIYANLEVETICSSFSSTQVLVQEIATKAAINTDRSLKEAHCIHFSCHGLFNLASPLESALFLANEERLTLGEIFGLDLSSCYLVTLSACETGLTNFASFSDEYIGLPSGFIYAGSTNVVSSLWKINDLSTAFLIIKFYQNLESTRSVAVALNKAQLWLRDITKAELKTWITANRLPLDPTMRQKLTKRLHKWQDNQKPFQNPFYWAAFCAIGQ
jgi:CHAT domain-containing protein